MTDSPGAPSKTPPTALPEAWTAPPLPEDRQDTKSKKSLIPPGAWWIAGIVILLLFFRGCAGGKEEASIATPKKAATPSLQAIETPESVAESVKKLEFLATNLDNSRQIRLTAANELISKYPNTPASETAKGVVKEIYADMAREKIGVQWRYYSNEESMSGGKTRFASVDSTNTINLDFPYSGEQRASLILRRHPRWGNDAILKIEKGQILCHSYGDCVVGIKFDDGKILRMAGNPPADNSTESVFIPAFGTFTKRLPSSKELKIEVQIYQHGSQVFHFDVSGFKPEKFQ